MQIDDAGTLCRRLQRLLRGFSPRSTSTSQLLPLAESLTSYLVLKCDLNMRQAKNPLVVKNLRLVLKKEKNVDGSEDHQPGVRTWCSLRLVEDFPKGSPMGGRETLLVGPQRRKKSEALAGAMEALEQAVKEMKGWAAENSSRQYALILEAELARE